MKRIIIFGLFMTIGAYISVSATIINIPDDYPTIQQGIDASSDGDTVLVQPGTYVENINFNGHNIVLGSLFLTTGDTQYISSTIIDGNQWGSVITFENGEDSPTQITGFTVQNGLAWHSGGGIYCESASPMVRHCLIDSCVAVENGGGIYCENSSILIESCMIKKNRAGDLPATTGTLGGGICCVDDYGSIIRYNIIMDNHSYTFSWTFGVSSGGGIYLSGNSNSQIMNNLIYLNSANCGAEWYAHSFGGGIFCSASSAIIRNNTIVDNSVSSTGGEYGIEASGGGFSGEGSVINTIIWGNIAFENPNVSGSPSVTYSCIESGWEGEGNIDCDPLFCDRESGDFYLAENSCCVGAGENGENIGAYGVGCEATDVIDESIAFPWEYTIHQNYPNPFNASTIIEYGLPKANNVTISIYDILGRKMETLVQGEQPAGYHRVTWDAKDHSSGMYFYRIQAGEYAESKKMLLLK